MRLQRVPLPDPMHRGVRQPGLTRHVAGRPVCETRWGGFSVNATTRARFRAVTVGGRPDLGRSGNPATPPWAKRRRMRLTCTTV